MSSRQFQAVISALAGGSWRRRERSTIGVAAPGRKRFFRNGRVIHNIRKTQLGHLVEIDAVSAGSADGQSAYLR